MNLLNIIPPDVDKMLSEMEFIIYLQKMNNAIGNITHQKKSDYAYYKCREYARHIKNRIVKEYSLSWEDFEKKECKNLEETEEILNKYTISESDKRKSAIIKEFVNDYTYFLSMFIKSKEGEPDIDA